MENRLVEPLSVDVVDESLQWFTAGLRLEMLECWWDLALWQERESHQLPQVIIDALTLLVGRRKPELLYMSPHCLVPVENTPLDRLPREGVS